MYGFELINFNNKFNKLLFDAIFTYAKSLKGYSDFIVLTMQDKSVKFFVCYETKNQAKIARNIIKATTFKDKKKMFKFIGILDIFKVDKIGDELALIPIEY